MNSPRKSAAELYLIAAKELFDSGSPISLNKVAIAAGKKEGSLRKERYPDVVKEVERLIELQSASVKQPKGPNYKDIVSKLREQKDELEARYSLAIAKVISLENQVFELTCQLESKAIVKTIKK